MASKFVLKAPKRYRSGTVVPTYGEVVRVNEAGRVEVRSRRAKEVLERQFGFLDVTIRDRVNAPVRRAMSGLKGLSEEGLAEAERLERKTKNRKTVLAYIGRLRRGKRRVAEAGNVAS